MNNLDINKDDLSQVELTETVGNIYAEKAKMSIRNANVYYGDLLFYVV